MFPAFKDISSKPTDFNDLLVLEGLEEVEYDGGQTALHAYRIAYLDAFISAINTLPATSPQRYWLTQRIQTSLVWVEAQGFSTLN